MISTYLTLKNRQIEIHEGPTVVMISDNVDAVALYLWNRGIDTWLQSSSMDFSAEEGWPTESAGDDVARSLAAIRS